MLPPLVALPLSRHDITLRRHTGFRCFRCYHDAMSSLMRHDDIATRRRHADAIVAMPAITTPLFFAAVGFR